MLQKSRGKKREQANLTNEIQNDENDDDEDAEEITRHKLPQTTSPKRSKKIKVDSDAKISREKTRSKSRQRTSKLTKEHTGHL